MPHVHLLWRKKNFSLDYKLYSLLDQDQTYNFLCACGSVCPWRCIIYMQGTTIAENAWEQLTQSWESPRPILQVTLPWFAETKYLIALHVGVWPTINFVHPSGNSCCYIWQATNRVSIHALLHVHSYHALIILMHAITLLLSMKCSCWN